jgi:hypothetical protein
MQTEIYLERGKKTTKNKRWKNKDNGNGRNREWRCSIVTIVVGF